MIDRNGVRVGVAGALVLLSGVLSPIAAQDTKSVVRVATSRLETKLEAKPAARVAPAVAEAAMKGDIAKVRALLAQQSDVNVAQGDGMTALHWAADRGDVAMTALLLRSGAKLAGTTRNGGYTPLHVAARAGHAAVVQALLVAGADANVLTSTGATAMHLAASAGDAASVKALLTKKADPNARESAWGQTPLMFAAAENRGDAVRALLAGGADASIRTKMVDLTEELARQQAAAKKRNEVLFSYLPQKTRDSIIDASAKATEKLMADAAAARNRAAAASGMAAPAAPATPAPVVAAPALAAVPVAAVPAASAPAVAAAPAPKADPALRGYKIGVAAPPTADLTPAQIQQAIEAGRALFSAGPVAKSTESAELFEGQVSGYETTVGGMGGMTALHHAARQGNTDAALAILDGGAKIDEVTTSDSTTALLMAAINGQFDLAMVLVKRGANVKIGSSAGLTPLYSALNTMWAPRSRYPQPQSVQTQKVTHLELMDAMLKAGADPNVRLKKNLWFFAYNNCGNANCGLEALDGTTPFWRAAYAVDVEAMKLLRDRGAIDTLPSFRPAAAARANRARIAGGAGGAGGPGELPGAFVVPPDIDSASKAVPPGIGVYPVHAAAGVGYGNGFAGNSHRHAADGWMPTMKYLVEVLHADVNQRDVNGYTPLHHAAARGDNEMIKYLVSKGADPKAVARNGMTTVDMANGPVQRLRPFPETIQLLEKLGAKNSHRCVAC
ncbi:ankyrin repeat domain-containing protein [Gemmatimonas sp.]|uniref:ankyrin repeat domain-containing protein n=1 Tax=Gemmatimonas sp. TaxID=1962908 RepID=UPI003564C288